MNTTPAGSRVSVALCTYNGEKYLAQQLDSLLAQTHAPYELIAADDASSDLSRDILQDYAPRFPRVRIIRNAINVGLGQNFQQAFSACTGDWIAPCDQDDIWEPDKLATLLQAAKVGHLLVYSDSALVDERGHPMNKKVSDSLPMISGQKPLAFTFRNSVSGHSCIFRRELLLRAMPFPEGIYYDWWLAFVASSLGSIGYVDRALVRFRRHPGTVTLLGSGRAKLPKRSPLERYAAKARVLQAFATVPSPHQLFYTRLVTLWAEHRNNWFSPALTALAYQHCNDLYGKDLGAASGQAKAGAKYLRLLPGLRLKMLIWDCWKQLGS